MTESLGPAAPETQTALVKCPRCAFEAPAGAHYCGQCGLDLTAPSPPEVDPAILRKVCSGCKTVNQAVFSYCYRCGLPLPAQTIPAARATGNPGGFWIRLGASAIDSAFFLAVGAILGLAIGIYYADDPDGSERVLTWLGGWQSQAVGQLIGMAFYTIFVGAWGATPGKRILGLRIVRTDGSRVSYFRGFARYWAYILSFLALGFGFLSIALSPQKRGWHDFLCDTRVVRTRG